MTRRLEIELTSQRSDGTWTWRVAGARLPKGKVKGELVPDSATVGSVLRAEALASLDSLEITSIMPIPKKEPEHIDRLELVSRSTGPLVTTALAPNRNKQSGRGDLDNWDHRSRRERNKRQQRSGPDSRGRRSSTKPRRTEHDKKQSDSTTDSTDTVRRSRQRHKRSRDHSQRNSQNFTAKRTHSKRNTQQRINDQTGRKQRETKKTWRSAWDRAPRLKPKRIHRTAVIDALPKEQQPLAREVLRGGIPGLRRTVKRVNARAESEKLPQIKAEPLIALAEQLLPHLKSAEWHDRAEAAMDSIDVVDLRDIRSVVVAADSSARTNQMRALAKNLKKALATRIESDHRKWLAELAVTLSENRTVRALRLSSRPPKAGSPLPPDIADRLTALASADLNAGTSQYRWSIVLDAVAFSPVRLHVMPTSLPDKPSAELMDKVRKLAGRVPHIADLFRVKPEFQRQRRNTLSPSNSSKTSK